MKNKIKMGLALLMFATVIPNTEFAQDSSNQVPSEQVEFADIYIGDELITVPVAIESEIAGKTARSGVQYEDTIESATYYIPVTEEGKAYNEEYVSGARARGTATDTYLDPRKYLTATSIIRYTMSSNDEYVLINNVAITKNRNPESSSTGGYLYGIGTPTARIVCVGLAKNNRGYEQVVDSQSVPWGTTGVSTPSWWTPVMCGSYSDQYKGLVQYSFNLIYSDGTVSCAFTHGLAK